VSHVAIVPAIHWMSVPCLEAFLVRIFCNTFLLSDVKIKKNLLTVMRCVLCIIH
jgi:hypothetical protein